MLAHLEKMDVADPRFIDRLTEFEHAVSHHAEREENEEFPPVLADHSEEELQALGSRLLKAEKNAPTHPHPAAAGSPTAQRVVGPFAALLDKARDNFQHGRQATRSETASWRAADQPSEVLGAEGR